VGHDAPHAHGFPFAIGDLNGKVSGGHKIDGVGRLVLPIEDLGTIGVLALTPPSLRAL
jgi:hypothetical protein